jgi:sugar lactone lactonase YvrE
MFSNNWMKVWMKRSVWLGAGVLAMVALTASAQTAPSIVVSAATTFSPSGLSSAGKVVQDTCGNLYELEGGGNLLELPVGGGAAQYLVSHGSDGLGGIAIDSSNSLYVRNAWNGQVIKIPSTSCVPNLSGAITLTSNSSTFASNLSVYWYNPEDLAVDPSGDLFIASNNCCNSNEIFELVGGSITGAGVMVLSGNSLPQVTTLAADSSGDVFFTVSGSGNVYEIPKASYGTSSPTAVITTGLKTAFGLSFDKLGNLYVGDTGTGSIYVVPFTAVGTSTTAALQFGSMYLFASGLPLGSALTVAQDGQSILYADSGASVYEQVVGSANFGSVATGSTDSTTISVAFNASESPASFAVTAGGAFTATGGSCAAGSYSAGQSCTIKAQFAPSHPGISVGGVTLSDSSNHTLATAYLRGTGLGAGLTLDSGVVSSIGSGFASPKQIAISSTGGFIADSGANAILYFATPTSTPVSIGSGLSKPQGVAVDGVGNVFIADTGNNQIVEVPIVNGVLSNSAQSVIVSATATISGTKLNSPAGITVDGQGNLYIADTGNNRILYLPFSGSWQLANATVLGSNFTAPLATTIDPWGNLYVANSGAGQIYRIPHPFNLGIQQLVAVGYSNPSGLATDASGSLFVVDQGAQTVLRIPNVAGSLDPNEALEVGFGINNPYGVTVDSKGSIYVTDAVDATAYSVNRVSVSEDFGAWAVGASSGSLPVILENAGNLPLVFNTPYVTASGNTGDFSLGIQTSSCASGGTVAVGMTCELDADFMPTMVGTRSETLALSSNAQNAASAQVVLSGDGVSASATTTILAITSPVNSTPSFGEPIMLTATVSAASGMPTGTAQLLVDGIITGESMLNTSGLANFALPTGLTGGSHSLQAVYLGTTSFDGSISSAAIIQVGTAPTTSAMAISTPYTSPFNALSGNTVSFTVTVASTGVGIPTGTVTFTTGSTTLGSAQLAPAAGGSFTASLATTALPTGSDLVTAAYSGDANYVASSTSGTVIIVAAPAVSFASNSTSIASTISASSSITFTPTSLGGWTGIVGYSCDPATLPQYARCVWSPGQVTLVPSTSSATAYQPTVNLTITIDQPPQTPIAGKLAWWMGGLTGLALLFARRRWMRKGLGSFAVLAGVILLGAATAGLTACNGINNIQYPTPTGSHTVTVYASADPFQSGSVVATLPCGVNSSTKQGDPTLAPCSQQSYQIALTVQ